MAFTSLGGKYSGVLTKKLKKDGTSFFIKYRDENQKVVRKKVGVSPEMTKAKALAILFETREEIRAKKELAKNPNSPIPVILKKKIDKRLYTLNDLADYYFEMKTDNSENDAMKNRYNYHFRNEFLATKNINQILEEDIAEFISRKKIQRADNRRSTLENNSAHLLKEGKRKRKSRSLNLNLEEREKIDYDDNNKEIARLKERIIRLKDDKKEFWREENKIKYLTERNKILGYRLFKEEAKKLDKDDTLSGADKDSLKGLLSNRTVKELLAMCSTIISFANKKKKLNIYNPFLIKKGDDNYLTYEKSKVSYLTKQEIKDYLKEVKLVSMKYEKQKYIYLISLLLLSTGARRNSVLSLKIENIDLVEGIINLRNFKTKSNFTSFVSSKEIKEEIIKISGNRPKSDFLFKSDLTGLRITCFPPKMKEILDYTVNYNRSYLNHLTIQKFRNTVASHLAMAGTPIAHISKILDHSSIVSTQIYAKVAKDIAKKDLGNFANDFLNTEE